MLPSVSIYPDREVAIVSFPDSDCGRVAAASFLKLQVDDSFGAAIREEIFEVKSDECAPHSSEGELLKQ